MKRIMSFLLCMAIMFVGLPVFGSVTALAEQEQAEYTLINSGTCGSNVIWKYYSNGLLEISGSGAMSNYWYGSYDGYKEVTTAPWRPYFKTIKTVVIHKGVTTIGKFSFCCCMNITSVSISDTVTRINLCAFLSCRSISSLVIPNSVTYLEDDVFDCCIGLTDVVLSNGLTRLKSYMFCSCSSLERITIPKSICVIDHDAFVHCTKLSNVFYTGTLSDRNQISIASNNDNLLNATWEYEWDGGNNSFATFSPGYHYEYKENGEKYDSIYDLDSKWSLRLFDEDNCTYNRDLAIAAICMSQEIYRSQSSYNILNRLEDLGFSKIGYTENLFSEEDWAKYGSPPIAFGATTYQSEDGTKKTVVSLTIQGTSDVATAITDIVDGGLQGFRKVGEIALVELKDFALMHSIDLTSEDTIFFITGHSLGGATAGRLAIELKNEGYNNKTFVYTFASAKYSTECNGVTYSEKDFPYVLNMVNVGDFVPTVAPWGTRVGRDFEFNSLFYIDEQSKIINKDKNQILYDFYSLEKLRQNKWNPIDMSLISLERLGHYHHLYTSYLPYILSGQKSNSQIDAEYNFDLLLSSIKCPVDIAVYDTMGQSIAYTESGDVTYCEESPVFIMVNGEDKYVLAPEYYPIDIEIVGTGEGTMDYSVQKLSSDNIELESISFENVQIETGKTMLSEVGGDKEVTHLYLTDSGEKTARIGNDGTEFSILTTGTYDGFEYILYADGGLRIDGEGALHFYDTNDNPMIIYKDQINTVDLGRNVVCDHRYDAKNVVIKATEDGKESVFHVCKMCFHEENLLKFSGTSLTLHDNMQLNFMVEKDSIDETGYENPYAVFIVDGNEITVSEYTTNDKYCIFSLNNIQPDKLNGEITATLYASYGDAIFSSSSITSNIFDFGKQGCDINGDGSVDIIDLIMLKKLMCNAPVSEESDDVVDLDFNGKLDALDLTYLIKILLFS